MSYSTDIAKLLTDQLTKFTTINRHQLVGQVANMDFWLAEARHHLSVIDGYGARFARLKGAQSDYVTQHKVIEFHLSDPCCTQAAPTPPRRIPHSELQEARRSLCDAVRRFLTRCFHEGLMTEPALREECENLNIGVEAADLQR